MNLELDGEVVLITGGSKGIGLACARAFGQEGAEVVIVSRSEDNLSAAQETLAEDGIEVTTFAADLSDGAAAERAVMATEEQVGPIGVLVNSAGGARRVPPAELTPDKWRVAMDAKFFTYMNVMDYVLPRMVERKFGSDHDRPGAEESGRGIPHDRKVPGGTAPPQPGAHPARTVRHHGGGRRRGALPLQRPGVLRDRGIADHGRRADTARRVNRWDGRNTPLLRPDIPRDRRVPDDGRRADAARRPNG